MKSRLFLSAVTAVVSGLLASSSMAANVALGQVQLNGSNYSFGNGGEFQAIELNNSGNTSPLTGTGWTTNTSTQNMPPALASSGQFQTFCIEAGVNDVTFSPGHIYNATMIDQSTNSNARLTLNAATAALYGAFATGNLMGYNFYNYAVGGSIVDTRAQSAGALQYAIWVAQGDASGYSQSTEAAQVGGLFNQTQFDAAVAWLESQPGGYGSLDSTELSQAWNFYSSSLSSYGSYATDTQVVALSTIPNGALDSAQAQLVEGSITPHVSDTPLPRSAFAGLSLLVGLSGVELLRKRYGIKLPNA